MRAALPTARGDTAAPATTGRRGRALMRALLGTWTLALAACASGPRPAEPQPPQVPVAATSSPAAPSTAPSAAAPTGPSAAVSARAAPPSISASGSPAADPDAAVGPPSDPLAPDSPLVSEEAARRDLWTRIRRGFAMPVLDNRFVRDREQWYASRPDYVQRMTERSSRYLFHIVEEVEKRGMPTELALLPFIESAFNPHATSTAKASGMWQFIPSTGRNYELRQNIFRDDRRDVLASTRAALDYLQKLHDQFDDWHLALAAYNWGEGSVSRAIARNQKAGLKTDYESLRMPEETQLYVPKLQAVVNLISRPEEFGLNLPALENHPYFLAVPIQRDIDADLVARLAGLPLAEFRDLNPSLNKPVILAAGTPQVLLPYDNANRFVHGLRTHRGPLASWTAWVVPRTMKPSEAALQHRMGEAELREVNRIPPRMLVKAGSTLLVPRSERRQDDVPERLADSASIQLAPDAPPTRRTVVTARKGDTVEAIAARYGLPAASVAHWNRTAPGAHLRAGQSVVLHLPATRARTAATARKPATAKAASGAQRRVAQAAR